MADVYPFFWDRMICPHKTTLLLASTDASRELLGASRESMVLNFVVWTRNRAIKLTMMRPSIRRSFCSKSQIWMRAFCRNQISRTKSIYKPWPKHHNIRRYKHTAQKKNGILQSTYALEEPEDEVLPPRTPTKDSPITTSNIRRDD